MPGALCRLSLSNKERCWSEHFGFGEERAIDMPFPCKVRPACTEKRCRFTPCKHKWKKPSHSQISQMFIKVRKDPSKADSIERRKNCQTREINDISRENDLDSDLAAMVRDFIENGTYNVNDLEDREMDRCFSSAGEICDAVLEALTSFTASPLEKNLKSIVDLLLSTENLKKKLCKIEYAECQGDVRRLVAQNLRFLGFNAAICITKWHNSGVIPGGEYEYIDVLDSESPHARNIERVIIDLDFKSQFEIARPTARYIAALKLVPNIFIGVSGKLEQLLPIMSEAAKHSLKQNTMPLPPWRTLEYMRAKWLTACDRIFLNSTASTYTSLRHIRAHAPSYVGKGSFMNALSLLKAIETNSLE